MSWIIASLLAFSQQASQEAKDFAEQVENRIDEDALIFLRGLYDKAHSDQTSQCLCNRKEVVKSRYEDPPEKQFVEGGSLKVFISFSVPFGTWIEHSKFLEHTEGHFVLRGLPGNSFQLLSKKLLEFREAGVNAPIQIDPEAFERLGITAVPTIVLEEGALQDKIVGNVRLDAALRKISESGSAKGLASTILQKASNSSFSNVGKTRRGGS